MVQNVNKLRFLLLQNLPLLLYSKIYLHTLTVSKVYKHRGSIFQATRNIQVHVAALDQACAALLLAADDKSYLDLKNQSASLQKP